MFFVRDRIMCHVVWPVCRRMPVWLYAATCRLVAIPFAAKLLLRNRGLVVGAAKTVGRSSLMGLLRMALEMAWYRLRYLDYYFYEGVPHMKVIWPHDKPETERCVYVLVNMRGSETIIDWMDHYPSVIVRMQFGSEGETSYATARQGFRWWGHLAEVRDEGCRGRLVAVNGSPLQYRKLVTDPRSIIIYQDLWHDHDGEPTVPFMGHQVPLKLGAFKLAKLCGGIPIRFVAIRPEGVRWVVRITDRLPEHDAAPRLVELMEKEILARPGAWEQWEIFLPKFHPQDRNWLRGRCPRLWLLKVEPSAARASRTRHIRQCDRTHLADRIAACHRFASAGASPGLTGVFHSFASSANISGSCFSNSEALKG